MAPKASMARMASMAMRNQYIQKPPALTCVFVCSCDFAQEQLYHFHAPAPTGHGTHGKYFYMATASTITTGTDYLAAQALQEEKVAQVVDHTAPEHVFFVEHSPVYTAGSSAKAADYLGINKIPVIRTGRGGEYTYHGPGQRVVYPIIDLRERGRDLRKYITTLQQWLINSLMEFNIDAHTREEVGVWVNTPRGPEKIAAIGVRVRKWVAFHGIALNVHPDMSHFRGIVPCGIRTMGVTSLHKLGVPATLAEVDQALIKHFEKTFATRLEWQD